MSYILDALKRNASDAEIGKTPSLQSQQVIAIDEKPKRAWRAPVVALGFTCFSVILGIQLKPWQPPAPQPQLSQIAEVQPQADGTLWLGSHESLAVSWRERVPLSLIATAAEAPVIAPEDKHQNIQAHSSIAEPVATKQSSKPSEPTLDLSDVDPQLRSLFDEAIQATSDIDYAPSDTEAALAAEPETEFDPYASDLLGSPYEPKNAPMLTAKPMTFQDAVPELEFTLHQYSSDPNKRWVKVNGHEAIEGDQIARGVTLVAILPGKVVMEMQGQMFYLADISHWVP